MSTQALTGLRDYLVSTLSVADMNWLAEELNKFAHKDDVLEPYTIEELRERIAEAERDFAEGRYFTDDEVFEDLGMVAEEQDELNLA